MKILLVGGGTGGPVRPLLVVAGEIKKLYPDTEFLLVGTSGGPESEMSARAGIAFVSIPSGKLRRYMSIQNVFMPLLVLAGFIRSCAILIKFRPDCVFGAGGFVQVPLVWAAWLLKVPVVIHQQDVAAGLANKLSQWFAARITVSFKNSMRDFEHGLGLFFQSRSSGSKVVWTGNPFSAVWHGKSREEGLRAFGLNNDMPTLFVTGGGTGAASLNALIEKALPELTKYVQIIHATGRGKNFYQQRENYKPYEFISNIEDAYAAADLVLARAGLSTITELAHLGKVSIIVPMPDSHQEINASLLALNSAALVAEEKQLTPEVLVALVRKLLIDGALRKNLSENIKNILPSHAADKIATIVITLAQSHANS